MKSLLFLLLLIVLCFLLYNHDSGKSSPAAVLPPDTIAFVYVAKPALLKQKITSLSVWDEYRKNSAANAVLATLYQRAALFLGKVSSLDLRESLEGTQALWVAVEPTGVKDSSLVLGVQVADANDFIHSFQQLLAVKLIPLKVSGYSSFRLERKDKAQEIMLTTLGKTVICTRSKEILRRSIRVYQKKSKSLADDADFSRVRDQTVLGWGFIEAQKFFGKSADNLITNELLNHLGKTYFTVLQQPGDKHLAVKLVAAQSLAQIDEGSVKSGFWTFIIYVLLAPFVLLSLLLVFVILLACYYYLTAWLTGNVYAKTIPEPAEMSSAFASALSSK